MLFAGYLGLERSVCRTPCSNYISQPSTSVTRRLYLCYAHSGSCVDASILFGLGPYTLQDTWCISGPGHSS